MTIRHPLSVLAVLGVAAFGAAGCGTKTLNVDKAETEISKSLASQTGASGVKVECPSDVEAKKGGTFTCTATDDDGNKGKITVTQKDDEGNISWKLN